jgi:transcription initiation factor TFIIB
MEREDEPTLQLLKDKCPECGSTDLIQDYDTGETACGNCGLVIQDVTMDEGPEWRAFTLEEKESRSRVGIPTFYSFHDKGLSTSIDRVDRDAYGRKLPLSTRLQMGRLRKWQVRSRVHSSIDRNLAQAMIELSRLSDKVFIPAPVKEKAAVIYRKALDKRLVRGRSIVAFVAASLYAACRITGTPRNLSEISEASLVSRKEASRSYRLLLRELDICMPIANPITFLSKIAERTAISCQTQGLAIKILQEVKEKHVSAGKNPMGLASAALYAACVQSGEKKSQKSIAAAAGVTEVTVRNRFKMLKGQLNLEMPD